MEISDRIEKLRTAASQNDDILYAELRDWLQDSLSHLDREKAYRKYTALVGQADEDQIEARLRGALGLFIFVQEAERWGSGHQNGNAVNEKSQSQTRLHEVLRDTHVTDSLYPFWKIPLEWKDEKIRLHAVGTTSFILEQEKQGRAMKLVKPWYWGTELIRTSTLKYKEYEGMSRRTPHIFDSGERYILMALIRGKTLREYIPTEGLKLYEAKRLISGVCSILSECGEKKEVSHGDLSSENVLVDTESKTDTPDLYLIDFGSNYLLSVRSERIGTPEAFRAAQEYIAPENRQPRKHSGPTVIGDVYSVGALLLEMLLPKEEFQPTNIRQSLDNLFDEYDGTGLGSLIEDILYPNKEMRLVGHPTGTGEGMYTAIFNYLSQRITVEIDLAIRIDKYEKTKWIEDLVSVGQTIIPGIRQIMWSCIEKSSHCMEPGKKLAPLTDGLHTSILVFGAIAVWNTIFVDTALEDLPALLVALAGSFIIAKYYVTALSTLKTNDLPWWMRFPIRMNAWFFALPCFLIIFGAVDRIIWPIAAATVLAVVVISQFACGRFCERVTQSLLRSPIDKELLSPKMQALNKTFQIQSRSNLAALIGLVIGAFLLLKGVLEDEAFYALLVVGASGYAYFVALEREGKNVRSGLARFANAYRRSINTPSGS